MGREFTSLQRDWMEKGRNGLIDNIKVLLYKQKADFFEFVDFENDVIYSDPFFFVYFTGAKTGEDFLNLLAIIYSQRDSQQKNVTVGSDEDGRVYLPSVGWLHTKLKTKKLNLLLSGGRFELYKGDERIDFEFEDKNIIQGTTIELLKFPIPLLNPFYTDVNGDVISVEIEAISAKQEANLRLALSLIKGNAPEHFQLIEAVTRSCVIFNVNPIQRNSFATQSAMGIAFFNAYQEEYNEVFFVDDIAHQTGHIIFMNLIYEVGDFLKIDPEMLVQNVQRSNNTTEKRTILVLIHALYTYYAIYLCLDECLKANSFEKEKKYEAIGRIGFYLIKCGADLSLVENGNEGFRLEDLFTEDGLVIFNEIRNKHLYMKDKWGAICEQYTYVNQPYNFSYSKFIELNPFDGNE